MAQQVKRSDLINYTQAMIRHAVYNYPNDVAYLLQSNGISVPQDADKQMLHVMTLKATESSKAFSAGLVELLHNVAMEGEYQKYKNATGDPAPTNAEDANSDKSWFAQTFNPKMVDTLLTAGVGLLSKQLAEQGDAGIKNATKPPVPPKKKSYTGLVIGSVVVVGIGVGVYFWLKHKKKA